MTTVTEVSLPASDVALAETFTALPDLEIRVKSVVAEGPLQTMPLVWIANAPRDDIEEALADDPTVDEFTCLLEDADTEEWLYRIEYDSTVGEVCGAIYDHDGTILDAQCSTSHWTFRLLFPDRDLLSATIDELEAQDIHVDVRRMVEAGRNADLEATAALTEAQEEAISEAYRRGYYDVPRQISLEELADELDISHQALSERLRRASKVLASEQVDEAVAQ
ncbi:helix-turn-helix domain-containing protein [Halobacteria archaeon AArc-m2/3/4]|uniref:Helix-turn-helix domain-containing protein n=1 Tax=Natronoglomus mannanivorans TaxID=2979990 RepID=A0AAP2YVS0_9EURY|nr:helix-turn-helix domain-containing protein [Halobacteria archaeon AArc-xg1-1]MCU4971487.1 helix-turn-helix domain-containing protein [Halobacteria archaeon AArc-m2/3/4]